MFNDLNEKAMESVNKEEPENALEWLKKVRDKLGVIEAREGA